MNDNPLYKEAFRLAVNGQSVFPAGPDKRPLIKSWKQYQEVAATPEQVTEWWTKDFPNANIALVTGKVSGVTVIDIDAYKEGAPKITDFPPTYTISTGNKGIHLYYQYQEGLTISANAYSQYPHLDMRSDGGFVIVAPSITKYQKDGKEAGGMYRVINPLPLADFPLAQFPQRPKKTLANMVGVSTGGRNDTLTSVIGTLLLAHPEQDWHTKVLPAVEKINATYIPPLPLNEVRDTFQSVVRLEFNRRAAMNGGSDNDEENDLRAGFVKNKTGGTFALAQFIVKKYDIITIGEKEREMYIYQNGLYTLAANEIIFPEIQRVLGALVTNSAKLETYHKIVDMTMSPREIFASAPINLIPLLNGVYDRDSKLLLAHSPSYRFTYQFPVLYDPDAECPRTEAFFNQVLDPEQRLIVEEWIGYYFLRNYMFKKAIIFVGEGNTGKTTLLEAVDFLLGKRNISSVSLQKMAGDKFAAAHMYEKHGNLVDELSAKDISDTGNFKIATGGGSISGEYKFGNQFSFHNFSKLTFACNKIPDIKDFDDDAYFNRWMPMRFERTIEKKIPDFIKTLTTDAERSGLFNLAMAGLDRLLTQGHFSYTKDAKDTKRDMMRSGSSIAMYAAARLKQDLGAEVSKEELYNDYTSWCVTNDLSVETMDMVGKKLPYYVPYASDGHITVYGKQKRGWRNVGFALTPEEESLNKKADEEFDNYGKN